MRISFHSNWLLFIICFFLSIVCASGAGGAERVALVIGNGAYGTSPLKNPVNDAVDMTRLLKSLDFEVIAKTDVNKKEMVEALNSFSSKLKKSKIGLFYFAGHGMQINGRNYLIPVRVEVADEGDVEFEAVDAARIISKMKSAENMLNMVILDACRNNPFQRSFRSSSQGLARMDAPKGTIIAYATSPGAVAADGQGRNGVFTKHLLDAMAVSNLDIQNVFNEAGMAVMKETGDRQIPWLSSTPIPRFFLAGGDAGGGARRDEQHRPGEKTIRPEPVGKPRKEAPVSLSVITTPSDSETRILNIRPPFKQGMKLDPGRYNVEVSRAGYGTETRWIELEPGVNSSIDITLQKNVSRKREQPQPPIEKKRDRVYPNG
ncbi:MAG: caspase family protein, partial [Thermodesulfobacteriota bacterium]